MFSAPEAFVLFGGLAKAGELLFRPVRENMEKNMLSIWKGKVKLLASELKEADAAVLGASALGWEAKPTPTPACEQPVVVASAPQAPIA